MSSSNPWNPLLTYLLYFPFEVYFLEKTSVIGGLFSFIQSTIGSTFLLGTMMTPWDIFYWWKPFSITTHNVFLYLSSDFPRFYQLLYLKYWSKLHFNQYGHSYYTKSVSLSLYKVTMKEDMWSWFQGLGYEEGSTLVRRLGMLGHKINFYLEIWLL